MIRTLITGALAVSLACTAGCGSNASTAQATSENQRQSVTLGMIQTAGETDEAVSLEECPAAVQTTIRAHMNGGAITELERTTDHGEVRYEVDVRTDQGIIEFDVAADGTFHGYENDAHADDDGAGDDDH